ncbi:acyl carrier protein [Streptomyces sp. NPDC056600]|uniref:acyl carrier protein n=1 Tax=Streptomyces sp. NPDC056600 TaxID=3345874 RepID=UPI0036A30FB3
MTRDEITQRLAELVAAVSDGDIPAEQARDAGVPLSVLGLTSLSRMRLIDAVETEFDVELELGERDWTMLDDLGALADHLEHR